MSAKAKKELTPKQKKIQTAINWIVNVLCILIIIFALVLSVVTIAQTTDPNNLPHLGKSYFMAVKTDSMSGTFEVGDMIITKQVSEEQAKNLEVGQVITFRKILGGGSVLINTHRIIEVINNNGAVSYKTQGDHEASPDSGSVGSGNVIATWGTPGSKDDKSSYGKVLKGVGKINNWLYEEDSLSASGKSTRYFLVIVLPLILLFVGYGFVMVYSLVKGKMQKNAEMAVSDLSEEDKERIAREYLASQGVETEDASVDEVEETDTPAEDVATEEEPVEKKAEEVEETVEEPSDDKKED